MLDVLAGILLVLLIIIASPFAVYAALIAVMFLFCIIAVAASIILYPFAKLYEWAKKKIGEKK